MGTVNIDIKTQDAQTLAALKRLEREFRGLDSTIDKTSKRGLSLGDALGGLAIGAGVKYAIGEFEDAERTSRKMEAAILASGNAAGISAEEQRKYADELANTIAVDNDVVIAAGTRLRAYQAIKGEKFHETLAVAADVAAAKEKDLAAVSDQLGKALNSPAQASKILRSLGISLTEQQQEQIKVMTEAGDVAGAQGLILDELKNRYAGAAEANVTDSQRMKVAMDDAAESAGKALAPALELTADTVGVLAGAFAALPVPIQQATFATGLGIAAWSKLSPVIDSGRTSIDSFLAKVASVPAGVDPGKASISGLVGAVAASPTAMAVGAAGVGLLTTAAIAMASETDHATDNAKALAEQAIATGRSIEDLFNESLANTLSGLDGGLSGISDDLTYLMDEAGVSTEQLGAAVNGSAAEYDAWVESVRAANEENHYASALTEKLIIQTNVMRDSSGQAAEQQDRHTEATTDLTGATDEATTATDDYIAKSGNLLGALDGSKTAWTDQAVAVRDANEALRDNMALAGDALTAKLNFDSAQRDVDTATLDLAEARASGDQAKIAEAEDRLTAAMQRQSEAAVTVADANAKVEGRVLSAGEAYLIQQGQLDGLRDKTGFWNDDLQVLEDRLKVFAETYKANIDTEDAKKKLIELIDLGNRARTALFGESAPTPGAQQTVPPPRDPDAGPRSLRGLSGPAGGSVIVNLNAPGMVVGATKKDAAIVARRASRKIAQQIRVAS